MPVQSRLSQAVRAWGNDRGNNTKAVDKRLRSPVSCAPSEKRISQAVASP